jgi:hypothetical protein
MAAGLASARHTSPRPFFGRQADLSYLLDRASSAGLTAVIGASWNLSKRTRSCCVCAAGAAQARQTAAKAASFHEQIFIGVP